MRNEIVKRLLVRVLRLRVSTATAVIFLSGCGSSGADPVFNPSAAPVDISVSVTGPASIPVGTVGAITITVENLSSDTASGIMVRDSLGVGLVYVGSTPSFGTYEASSRTWDIGTLGARRSVTLIVRARAEAAVGSMLRYGAALTRTATRDSNGTNDIGSATVQVAAAAASTPVTFSSEWNFARGNSREALNDGGTWDRMIECGGSIFNIMSVIDGATVGWTMTPNVLRIQQRGSTACGNIERTQNTVAPSTSHWGRFYFRNDETANGHFHPVTYNCCGAIQMVPWLRFGNITGVRIGVGTARDGNGVTLGYPYSLWFPGTRPGAGAVQLENGRWYRYEWEIRYVTPMSYRVYPRIYDMNNNLLFDYRTFFQNDNAGGAASKSLQTFYEVDNRTFGVTDPALARNFGFGNEGPGGSSNSLGYWYIARSSVSTTGWIGP